MIYIFGLTIAIIVLYIVIFMLAAEVFEHSKYLNSIRRGFTQKKGEKDE
jgi:hypothetical protein